MRNDSQRRMLGNGLLVAIALSLNSCRTDKAPPIDVGIGDGFGGADATLSTGEHIVWKPSDLDGAFIIRDPKQAQAFVSWCYDTSSSAKYK